MKYYLKAFIIISLNLLLRVFYIFPIKKNTLIFSSYEGLQYSCNPKYLFQYIYSKEENNWKYIWVLNNKNHLPEEYRNYVKTVKFLSLKHIYYLLTSKVIISNLGIEPFVPKRKSQIFINTWHGGGAYKMVNAEIALKNGERGKYIYEKVLRKLRAKSTDYYISSCQKFSQITSKDMLIPGKCFLNTGMPRNDILKNHDGDLRENIRKNLSKIYGIPIDSNWVLYAPTFRGDWRKSEGCDYNISEQNVFKSFKEKFGKDVALLVRTHVSHSSSMVKKHNEYNVSNYPDMQELLLAVDILITDYSSSIWDYALTEKPGFLYTPDLEEYMERKGFYTPIDEWQYPYAKSSVELSELILFYDEGKALVRIKNHLRDMESYEKGNACEQVYKIIKSKI